MTGSIWGWSLLINNYLKLVMTITAKELDLHSMPCADVLNLFTDGATSVNEGKEIMGWFLAYRENVANEVLCLMYDVWCYKIDDTCFRDQVDPSKLDKWFVSIPANSKEQMFENSEVIEDLYLSRENAEEAAVKGFNLVSEFFGKKKEEEIPIID